MQKTKFNKRAGKETPVVRCVESTRGLQYCLAYNPAPGIENELLVRFPAVLLVNPPFQKLSGVSWPALRDWLYSKAAN